MAPKIKEYPLNEINMRAIVKESGISQGCMYSYFSILYKVLDRKSKNYYGAFNVHHLLKSPDNPEVIIRNIFKMIGLYFKERAVIFCKAQFLLNTNKLLSSSKPTVTVMNNPTIEDAWIPLVTKVYKWIEEGYFKPIVEYNSITNFATIFMDGLASDILYSNCFTYDLTYENSNEKLKQFLEVDIEKSIDTFVTSLIYLLNPTK